MEFWPWGWPLVLGVFETRALGRQQTSCCRGRVSASACLRACCVTGTDKPIMTETLARLQPWAFLLASSPSAVAGKDRLGFTLAPLRMFHSHLLGFPDHRTSGHQATYISLRTRMSCNKPARVFQWLDHCRQKLSVPSADRCHGEKPQPPIQHGARPTPI